MRKKNNKRLILIYLVPVKMLLGKKPRESSSVPDPSIFLANPDPWSRFNPKYRVRIRIRKTNLLWIQPDPDPIWSWG
jgi:hypothetical protein